MGSYLSAASVIIVAGLLIGTRLRAWVLLPPACAVLLAIPLAGAAGLPTGIPMRIGLAVAALALLELGFFLGACWRFRSGVVVPTS